MKVAVIDNDTALLRSLQVLLGCRGHQVVCIPDAHDAVETIKREVPDVILVDLVLPGSWGPDVIREVRQCCGTGQRVILISGHTDLVEELDLERVGVSAFLPKPIDFQNLACVIEGNITLAKRGDVSADR